MWRRQCEASFNFGLTAQLLKHWRTNGRVPKFRNSWANGLKKRAVNVVFSSIGLSPPLPPKNQKSLKVRVQWVVDLGIKRETFPWSNELDKILRTQPVGAQGDVELICDVSTSHSADVKLDEASGEWLINGTSGRSVFSTQTEYSIDIPSTGI